MPVWWRGLAETGGRLLAASPTDLGQLMAQRTEKWANALKFAAIKPE